MTVAQIINEERGTRFDIVKLREDFYRVDYYEYYTVCGWRFLFSGNELWSRDAIEWEFEIQVARHPASPRPPGQLAKTRTAPL